MNTTQIDELSGLGIYLKAMRNHEKGIWIILSVLLMRKVQMLQFKTLNVSKLLCLSKVQLYLCPSNMYTL